MVPGKQNSSNNAKTEAGKSGQSGLLNKNIKYLRKLQGATQEAFAAGHLDAPPGENVLELSSRLLETNPRDEGATELRFLVGLLVFSFAITLVHLNVIAAQVGNGFFASWGTLYAALRLLGSVCDKAPVTSCLSRISVDADDAPLSGMLAVSLVLLFACVHLARNQIGRAHV